jgi:hypothetical protein
MPETGTPSVDRCTPSFSSRGVSRWCLGGGGYGSGYELLYVVYVCAAEETHQTTESLPYDRPILALTSGQSFP